MLSYGGSWWPRTHLGKEFPSPKFEQGKHSLLPRLNSRMRIITREKQKEGGIEKETSRRCSLSLLIVLFPCSFISDIWRTRKEGIYLEHKEDSWTVGS